LLREAQSGEETPAALSSKEPADTSASNNPPEREAEVREHLANERTLLAWVRTGVGLLSFGLVIERLGAEVGSAKSSGVFGVALAALGCLSLIMGTFQFLRNRRGIVAGDFTPAVVSYMIVVVGSLVLALAFIGYVLVTVWIP
jgi:putative membrane protein